MKEILKNRIDLLIKAKENTQLQSIEKELCKRDVLYFFNNYLYTDKNTNLYTWDEPNIIPFIPYEFQIELITEVRNSIQDWTKPIKERSWLTNIFIEKSRQMWISWLIMWIFVYWYIFHDHKYHVISQKEESVDKTWDMKSLFEKARFMLRNLPKWMLPEWYSTKLWTPCNKYMTISRFDWTGAITWESANPDASRWWTYQAIFLDEMAFMQNATTINSAAANATPCRIFNSTPNWEWNEFYRMRELTQTRIDSKWITHEPEIKWLRYHWTDHPKYNMEWYKWKTQWMTKEKIAQELEIDYHTAIEWRVYPEFSTSTSLVSYNYEKPLYITIDNSHWWTDPNAIIVIQPEDHYFNVIDAIEVQCTPLDCAEFLSCQPKFALTYNQEQFLSRYKKYNRRKAIFIADPYDTKSALWNSTILDDYKKVWINLFLPEERRKTEQILKTRTNIYRIRYNDNCKDFASAILNSKYPERKETSQATTEIVLPVHNWTSHFRTALEYFITYILENPLIETKRILQDDRPIRNKVTWKLIYPNKR